MSETSQASTIWIPKYPTSCSSWRVLNCSTVRVNFNPRRQRRRPNDFLNGGSSRRPNIHLARLHNSEFIYVWSNRFGCQITSKGNFGDDQVYCTAPMNHFPLKTNLISPIPNSINYIEDASFDHHFTLRSLMKIQQRPYFTHWIKLQGFIKNAS